MFKIIGADQQEYGPVEADQIRQWIVEGRANGATLVQVEGSTEWVALSTLPEFADVLATRAPAAPASAPPPPSDPQELAAYVRSHDYEVDIGQCISRSWRLLQANAALFVGATVLFLIIGVGFSQLLGLFTRGAVASLRQGDFGPGPILLILFLNIPGWALWAVLSGGLYQVILKRLRGQPAGIGDLFAGFTAPFIQLAAAGIVVQLLTILGILLCVLPGVYLSVGWILTVPLIMDRDLDFWAAMELSRKAVTQHWWMIFCLVIVVALLNIAGLVACCVGIFAAFPLGIGALLYAYEDIFHGPGSTAS